MITPYTIDDGMSLPRKGYMTIRKLKSSRLTYSSVVKVPLMSCSR